MTTMMITMTMVTMMMMMMTMMTMVTMMMMTMMMMMMMMMMTMMTMMMMETMMMMTMMMMTTMMTMMTVMMMTMMMMMMTMMMMMMMMTMMTTMMTTMMMMTMTMAMMIMMIVLIIADIFRLKAKPFPVSGNPGWMLRLKISIRNSFARNQEIQTHSNEFQQTIEVFQSIWSGLVWFFFQFTYKFYLQRAQIWIGNILKTVICWKAFRVNFCELEDDNETKTKLIFFLNFRLPRNEHINRESLFVDSTFVFLVTEGCQGKLLAFRKCLHLKSH